MYIVQHEHDFFSFDFELNKFIERRKDAVEFA